MALIPRPFPPVLPHGEIREVLPGLFVVTGTIGLPGPLPVRFSRNMTIVREDSRLVLINTVRLDDGGLAALDQLGKVTDVIRLAGFHGADDPFYADRYGAKVWALAGQRYTPGFETNAADTYFAPQAEIDASTPLPIAGARLHFIHSRPPEGLLLLPRHGGTLVAGDCFQNWASADEHFSWPARVVMPFMGFIRPHNIGPAWLRQSKPPKDQLRAILGLGFANVIPAHGTPVLGDAAELYGPAVRRAVEGRP